MQKEHNIWLKRYKTTRSETFSSSPRCVHYYLSIQALTMLNLKSNQIGAEGAQHLAQALQNNRVRDVFFFPNTYLSLSLNAGTHDARSSMQPYRCRRSTTSGSSITKEHGERRFLLFQYLFPIILQYRHSPRSHFYGTKSVQKEHNIWLKHYKRTR